MSQSTITTTIAVSSTRRTLHADRARTLGLVLGLALVSGLGVEHQAFAFLGQGVIEFASSYIVAPLGLFAVLVALAASVIRPDLARGALWASVVCAVMFMIMSKSGEVISALQR